jgi:predicted RNase H-like HicB family nuclease
MRYAVILEKTATGYSAYPPDLPGVGAAGETIEEVVGLIREAIKLHVEGMLADGVPIPEPSRVEYVDISPK